MGFFVRKAYRFPASSDGPRQIVSHFVLERATNLPSGRTGSGSGACATTETGAGEVAGDRRAGGGRRRRSSGAGDPGEGADHDESHRTAERHLGIIGACRPKVTRSNVGEAPGTG